MKTIRRWHEQMAHGAETKTRPGPRPALNFGHNSSMAVFYNEMTKGGQPLVGDDGGITTKKSLPPLRALQSAVQASKKPLELAAAAALTATVVMSPSTRQSAAAKKKADNGKKGGGGSKKPRPVTVGKGALAKATKMLGLTQNVHDSKTKARILKLLSPSCMVYWWLGMYAALMDPEHPLDLRRRKSPYNVISLDKFGLMFSR